MTCYFLQRRAIHSSLIAVTLIAGSVRMAAAQSDPESYRLPPGPLHPPIPPYPVEMGFSQHHSSTLQEGWQRGRAALIQAFGNFLLSASQAEIYWEHARALNRENDLKQTQALYEQQDMWRERRQQLREARDARREAGQQKLAVRRTTVYRNTYQLTSGQFDPVSGKINWPAVLQDVRYQQAREHLQELFRVHVEYGAPQAETAAEIARNVEPLIRALRDAIDDVPRDEYLAAQKFLRCLKYEAKALVETA